MQKIFTSLVGLVVIAAIVLAVNLIGTTVLRPLKFDITEEKLFTLSEGSENIAASLDDTIVAKYYYSKTALAEITQLKTYANRVYDLLREYEAASDGKLTIEVIDPRPDTEEEADAERSGLQGAPLGDGERVFIGLVFQNKDTAKETRIAFFNPQEESSLEYDISKALYTIAHPEKKKIGVISSLPVMGSSPQPQMNPMAPPPQQSEPWVFVQKLQATFNVSEIQASATSIPTDLDLLMVIHPKDLNKQLQYSIDQYVLAGGKAIVFVDPMCEEDANGMRQMAGNNMQALMQAEFNSDMPELLKSWGVELVAGNESSAGGGFPGMDAGGPSIVGDLNQGTPVQTRNGVEDMIVWLSLRQENFTNDKEEGEDKDIITHGLTSVMLATAGALKVVAPSDRVTAEPLIETSKAAAASIGGMQLKFGMDPAGLRKDFKGGDTKLALAYRLTGKFKTAFPNGKPTDDSGDEASAPEGPLAHLTEAAEASTVIVVADADMISDGKSIRMQRTFFGNMAQKLNDNLDFVYNAAENLSGSQDLISLRTRGNSQRAFTRVQEIQRKAQEKFRDEEAELNGQLEKAEAEWQEFQKSTNDIQVLTTELTQRRQDLIETRSGINKKLTDVRRSLREEIEQLGFKLKFINIALMPLLVVLLSIIIGVVKSAHRKRQMAA